MHVGSRQLRQQNVAGHHQFLGDRRPAMQPESVAPKTLVHDSIRGQRVILAMIENREVEHSGVLERPSHQFMILHALPVIRDRHDSGFFQVNRSEPIPRRPAPA